MNNVTMTAVSLWVVRAHHLFSTFTDAIVHILKERFGVLYIIKPLDDFLFIAKSSEEMFEVSQMFF